MSFKKEDLGIFITTFSKRFNYVENLINSIRNQSDIDIFININGDYKKNIDEDYKNKILNLCIQHKNVYPRFYNVFRSYGYMCNDFICNGGKIGNIITNDDVLIESGFIENFLKFLQTINLDKSLVQVNNSFSTYYISRSVARKNKFYDERFLGLGWEDSDFTKRSNRWNVGIELISFNTNLHTNDWPKTWNTLIDQNATTISKYHNFNYKMFYQLNQESFEDYIHPRPNEDFFFDNYDTFWNYKSTDYMDDIDKQNQEINIRKNL